MPNLISFGYNFLERKSGRCKDEARKLFPNKWKGKKECEE
jgi:hypothetical protein